MIEIHHRADAPVASEIAFNYDDDHRNVPAWMFGVTAFDPATELSHGMGDTYNTAMQVGPKAVPFCGADHRTDCRPGDPAHRGDLASTD